MKKDVMKTLERWIAEGNKVAVYKNVDLSSHDIGRIAFMKVGKGATFKKAPQKMPDSPSFPIAWRYYHQETTTSKKKLRKLV